MFTVTSWIVKRDRNREFVIAWKAFAKWLASQNGLTFSTQLLKDTLDSAHYISVDYWEDEDTSAMIRGGVEFGRQSYRLQQLTLQFFTWNLTFEASEQASNRKDNRKAK